MEAIRRWNARRRSPSFRAIQDAGPPMAWIALGVATSLVAVGLLWLIGVRHTATLVAVPFVAFFVFCLIDRDGWRIRMASAELANLQVQRMELHPLPSEPRSAETWLLGHPDAPPLVRASILMIAGRPREARDLADGAVGATPQDVVSRERMRLTIGAALGESRLDRRAAEAFEALPELAALTDEERRYHRLSLAWSAAWIEIQAHRPWRAAHAATLRRLGPFRPPLRYVTWHAIQQFRVPIAYVLALLIVSWLGMVDVMR